MPMAYSAKLLDHFHHPRHAGELADATVVAEATNPVCGDVMKLWLRVEGGRLTAATFKADGCVPSIACGDWLAGWLSAGCTLDEARSITPATIAARLDGLPPASSHAADLAVDVLRKALDAVSPRT
ncbi:MAG TPA: iron-sulfur cluster assembly scaffold protein [Terriglobia bacterium]|nr:iron-sulfur cluster assembly scaffold protein [Terriglobia bacterium]